MNNNFKTIILLTCIGVMMANIYIILQAVIDGKLYIAIAAGILIVAALFVTLVVLHNKGEI